MEGRWKREDGGGGGEQEEEEELKAVLGSTADLITEWEK